MALIESVKEGAHGAVVATVAGSSLVHFKARYLGYGDGAAAPEPGAVVDDAELAYAAACTEAEAAATALIYRAEQYRAGLERKLSLKGHDRKPLRAALDHLEGEGLLCDRRFAAAWIRQRLRRRAEGPASLRLGLASRGVERSAVELALAELLDGESRPGLIRDAAERSGLVDPAELKGFLKGLGWKGGEIDEALDR